jgi:hypothetical protein
MKRSSEIVRRASHRPAAGWRLEVSFQPSRPTSGALVLGQAKDDRPGSAPARRRRTPRCACSPSPSMSKALRDTKWRSRSTAWAGQMRPPVQRVAPPRPRLAHGMAAAQAGQVSGNWYGTAPALAGRPSPPDDLRDHVAGALQDHPVADAHVLALDLVLVVQRRARDHDAADGDRLQLRRPGSARRCGRPGSGCRQDGVSACSAGNLWAIAQRGARPTKPRRLPASPGGRPCRRRRRCRNRVSRGRSARASSVESASASSRSSADPAARIDRKAPGQAVGRSARAGCPAVSSAGPRPHQRHRRRSCSGRDRLVIRGSQAGAASPAAALRGLAKTGSPAASRAALSARKSGLRHVDFAPDLDHAPDDCRPSASAAACRPHASGWR